MPSSEEFKAQGNKAFAIKKYQEAADLYSSAIALDGSNPVLYSNRAQCHIHLRDWIRASNDVEVGLRLQPADKIKVKLLFRKGLTAKGLGNIEMAKRAFKDALQLDPENLAAANELEQVQPKKLKREGFVDREPRKISIEVVDELPSEILEQIRGEPAPPSSTNSLEATSADVNAVADELFRERKNKSKDEVHKSKQETPFVERSTMHYLKTLKSLPPERKHNGYKVVLDMSSSQLDEMFAFSGIESDFFEFFLEASVHFLKNHTEYTSEQILDKLEYITRFKRYNLTAQLTPDDLIQNFIDALDKYGFSAHARGKQLLAR
ncbi:hypothetical protein FDK38_001957 [Candidozyma auris]|nr:hypothetical protein FDK38_001957 [[Candida] auris]